MSSELTQKPTFRISIFHVMLAIVYIFVLITFFGFREAIVLGILCSIGAILLGFLFAFLTIGLGEINGSQIEMKNNWLGHFTMFLLASGVCNIFVFIGIAIFISFGLLIG